MPQINPGVSPTDSHRMPYSRQPCFTEAAHDESGSVAEQGFSRHEALGSSQEGKGIWKTTYLSPFLSLYSPGCGRGSEDLQSFCSLHYRPGKE
jgi:hypothetical protein